MNMCMLKRPSPNQINRGLTKSTNERNGEERTEICTFKEVSPEDYDFNIGMEGDLWEQQCVPRGRARTFLPRRHAVTCAPWLAAHGEA